MNIEQKKVQLIIGSALQHSSGFSFGPLEKFIAHPWSSVFIQRDKVGQLKTTQIKGILEWVFKKNTS